MFFLPFGFGFGFLFIILGILLVPFVLFLLTLQNTLKAIAPQNRRLEPELVWLMFIPFFNLVWQFIVVIRIADSIKADLESRQIHTYDKPTLGIGLAHCILLVCFWFPFAGIAGLICTIVYWVKVYDYKKMFEVPYKGMNDSRIFNNL